MPLPRALARLNRHLTNPVVRLFAGHVPGFCILRHVGRRTGRDYHIPLNVFPAGERYVFALTYGAGADWVKNVVAAGECRIRRGGEEVHLTDPRFLPAVEGMAAMPGPARPLLRLAGVSEFLSMTPVTRTR